jgi:peptidyl-prolyl cis-trans isomerase C
MSNPNNKLPIVIGAVAILAIAAIAIFFVSGNMKKGNSVSVAQENNSSSSVEETASSNGAEPAAPSSVEEENEVADATGGAIDGVKVEKGNPVVAKVDGKEITRVDVFRYIKLMPANIQQLPAETVYPLALDQVINTRLVQNKAESAGLENDPEVKEQLDLAKQQLIRSVYVQRAVDKQISEGDMKKAYNEYVGKIPAVKEIKASHILVETEDKAKEIIAKLKDGGNFAALAKENSGDPGNKDKGGELGWFSAQDMVPEFSEAAFKLGKGKISETPVKTQFGWHVVKVEDSRDRPKPSYDELKPMIQVELRRQKLEGMLDNWKSAAKIEKYDINGKPVNNQSGASTNEVAPAAGSTEEPAAE